MRPGRFKGSKPFGPAGTSGTDYTFVLDFNSGITALTLSSDFTEDEINKYGYDQHTSN